MTNKNITLIALLLLMSSSMIGCSSNNETPAADSDCIYLSELSDDELWLLMEEKIESMY
ncbi:MAG: hypothetical protein OXG88_08875 [Gammaproteobacteria bacterium]|nr:hypothetical protein [Gammaproteobacteria bacterium]